MLWIGLCYKGAIVLFSLLVHLQSQVGFREGFEFVRSIDGLLPTLVVAVDNVAHALSSRSLLADTASSGSTYVQDVLVRTATSLGLRAPPSTPSVMFGPAYCSDLIVRPTSDLTIYTPTHQPFLGPDRSSQRPADTHLPMISPTTARAVGTTMMVFYLTLVGLLFILVLDCLVWRKDVRKVRQEKIKIVGGQFKLDVAPLAPLTEDEYLPKANDWFQRIATGVSDPAISAPYVSLVQSDSPLSLPPVVADIQIEWFDGAAAASSQDYVVAAEPEQQCPLQDGDISVPSPAAELIVPLPESPINDTMPQCATPQDILDALPEPSASVDENSSLIDSPSVYEDSSLSESTFVYESSSRLDSLSLSVLSQLPPASPASIDAASIPLPSSPNLPSSRVSDSPFVYEDSSLSDSEFVYKDSSLSDSEFVYKDSSLSDSPFVYKSSSLPNSPSLSALSPLQPASPVFINAASIPLPPSPSPDFTHGLDTVSIPPPPSPDFPSSHGLDAVSIPLPPSPDFSQGLDATRIPLRPSPDFHSPHSLDGASVPLLPSPDFSPGLNAASIPSPPSPDFPSSRGVSASIRAPRICHISWSAPASPNCGSSLIRMPRPMDAVDFYFPPGTVIYETPRPTRRDSPSIIYETPRPTHCHSPTVIYETSLPPRHDGPTVSVSASTHRIAPPSKEVPLLPEAAPWVSVHGPPTERPFTRSPSPLSDTPHDLPVQPQGVRAQSSDDAPSIHARSSPVPRALSTPPCLPLPSPASLDAPTSVRAPSLSPPPSGVWASMHAPPAPPASSGVQPSTHAPSPPPVSSGVWSSMHAPSPSAASSGVQPSTHAPSPPTVSSGVWSSMHAPSPSAASSGMRASIHAPSSPPASGVWTSVHAPSPSRASSGVLASVHAPGSYAASSGIRTSMHAPPPSRGPSGVRASIHAPSPSGASSGMRASIHAPSPSSAPSGVRASMHAPSSSRASLGVRASMHAPSRTGSSVLSASAKPFRPASSISASNLSDGSLRSRQVHRNFFGYGATASGLSGSMHAPSPSQ